MPEYRTLEFTDEFLVSLLSRDFSTSDRRAFLRALYQPGLTRPQIPWGIRFRSAGNLRSYEAHLVLRLLDDNERHPSLRVHQLHGEQRGIWSATASETLRITFRRLDDGVKRLLRCSKHDDR